MAEKDRAHLSRAELLAELEKLEAALQRLTTGGPGSNNERLLYDLHVHQLELESQNQALRDMSQRLEMQTARYADLYDFAPVRLMS
jgi:hypothetical protein